MVPIWCWSAKRLRSSSSQARRGRTPSLRVLIQRFAMSCCRVDYNPRTPSVCWVNEHPRGSLHSVRVSRSRFLSWEPNCLRLKLNWFRAKTIWSAWKCLIIIVAGARWVESPWIWSLKQIGSSWSLLLRPKLVKWSLFCCTKNRRSQIKPKKYYCLKYVER